MYFGVMHKKGCIVLYDLYDTIKQECKRMNVSVSRMCLDLGMSKSTLSSLKNGKTKTLSAPTLSAIANYLGVSVGYLLGEKEKPTPSGELDDDELNAYLQDLRDRPEMRMLFSLTRNATREDVEQAVRIIEAIRTPGNQGQDGKA